MWPNTKHECTVWIKFFHGLNKTNKIKIQKYFISDINSLNFIVEVIWGVSLANMLESGHANILSDIMPNL